MALNDNRKNLNSPQQMDQQSFDPEYEVKVVEPLGYDGKSLQRLNANNMQIKVTTVGSVTYVAKAAPGTAQSEAKWQAKKVDTTTGVVITWADSANYTQVATDLTSLTYA